MERKTKFTKGEYHHIFNRGVEKRQIFLNKRDYERFFALLYILNQKSTFRLSSFLEGKSRALSDVFKEERDGTLVSVLSYSLMPNHFHLFLYETSEGGISKFMSKLLTAYSMYFNKKYDRSGPLFVRPFRSVHVRDEAQFNFLFQYVNFNPLELFDKNWEEKGFFDKKAALDFMLDYRYTSYIDLIGEERAEGKIISKDDLPDSARGVLADFFSNNGK